MRVRGLLFALAFLACPVVLVACAGDDTNPPPAADGGPDATSGDASADTGTAGDAGSPDSGADTGAVDGDVDAPSDGGDAGAPDDAAPDASDAGPDASDAGPDASDAAPDDAGPDASDAAPDDAAPDASDAGLDAGPADASPEGQVTMNVTLNGAPEPGVLVVFQDSEGAILTSGTTDATGAFASVVPAGSQVTVVLLDGNNVELETVTALAPGDVLTANNPGPQHGVTVDVTSVPANPPAGTTQDEFVAGDSCLQNATPGTTGPFTIYAQCLGSAGQLSLLAYALDTNFNELAFTFQKGISVLDDGGFDGFPVSFTGTWSPPATVELSTPLSAVPMGTLVYEESSGGEITAESPGPPIGLVAEDGGLQDYSFAATSHPGYPDAVQVEGSVFAANAPANAIAMQARATRITPPTSGGAIAVDVTNMLPPIMSASFGAGDAGASPPAITWTTAAPLSEADAVVAWVWGSASPLSDVYMTWTFFGPATTTSFSFPTLPPGATPFDPGLLASTVVNPPVVYAIDVSFFGGYGDFKTGFASFLPGQGLTGNEPANGVVPLLPSLGSARVTTYSAPP